MWIKVDSFSKMIAFAGNEISRKAFLGYMNRYAWQMKPEPETENAQTRLADWLETFCKKDLETA